MKYHVTVMDMVYAAVKHHGSLHTSEVPAAIRALFPNLPQPSPHTIKMYLSMMRNSGRLVRMAHGVIAHPDAVVPLDDELQTLLS